MIKLEMPHNLDIEAKVLASLINDNDSIYTITDILKASSFYNDKNRLIFNAAKDLYNTNKAPDISLLAAALINKVDLLYISEVANNYSGLDVLLDYCRLLKELEIRRDMLAGIDKLKKAANLDLDIFDLSAEITSYLDKVGDNPKETIIDTTRLFKDTFNAIEMASNNPGGCTGISSGFNELDRLTNGFNKGELIIVAARPGMGKTTLALNFMLEAVKQNKRVLMYSIEMMAVELGLKLVSNISNIDGDRISRGKLTDEEYIGIHNKTSSIINSGLINIDADTSELFSIKSLAKKLNHKAKLDMIIIDYMQLISGGDKENKQQNREQQISYISRSLKALAKELDIPIICLSQLSRAVESRGNKRPMLSDLRESGAIEQDANKVIFIYRDGYYNKNNDSSTEIIVAKNRNGSLGTTTVQFYGGLSTFKSDNFTPF
jgi:replicative DNA helicase